VIKDLVNQFSIPGAKLNFCFTESPRRKHWEGVLSATLPDAGVTFQETVTISFEEAAEFTLMESAEEKIAFMRGKFQEAYLKLKAKAEEFRKEHAVAELRVSV